MGNPVLELMDMADLVNVVILCTFRRAEWQSGRVTGLQIQGFETLVPLKRILLRPYAFRQRKALCHFRNR